MTEQISGEARLLLTSAGITTDVIRDHLATQVGSTNPNILRFSDGWEPFEVADRVSLPVRLAHSWQSGAIRWWSEHYLDYAFGDSHSLKTISGSNMTDSDIEKNLCGADIVLIPGGNTYLTARGLGAHIELIREKVQLGSFLLLGESAGSIFAGSSLGPANIDPADENPFNVSLSSTLKLIDADIVVHAPERKEKLALPLGKIASIWLGQSETSVAVLQNYISSHDTSTLVYTLNDAQALQISNGQLTIVGEDSSRQYA